MTERTWCPSLGLQGSSNSAFVAGGEFSAVAIDPFLGERTSAKRDAAVAANSGASAKAITKTLANNFQRRFQKFDAAVVASNRNRQHWPGTPKSSNLEFSDFLVPADAALCLNVQQLQNTRICTSQLAVLCDQISDIFSLLARRSAATLNGNDRDMFSGLVGLPSTSQVASMSELFSTLVSSKAFLTHVHNLSVSDLSGGDESTQLAHFVRSASHLEVLHLVNCALQSDMSAFMEALKDGELKRLSLARSSIGCSPTDPEREAILAAMAAFLKLNKFLISLDLSYTNLDAGAVSALMSALTESDTQMLPQDMDETPDTFDPSNFSERLSRAGFGSGEGRSGATNSEDGERENEMEDETKASSQEEDESTVSKDATGNDDDDDDDTGEGDEGQEEDEDGESGPSRQPDKAAEKEQANRDRERRRVERQQVQQHRKEAKQNADLEAAARRTLVEEYLSSLSEIVAANSGTIAKCYSEEKQKKKELYCSRRSGWSRLQALVLRGNRLGDAGAKQIALVLREEVPLTDDEAKQCQEAADTAREALGSALGTGRAAISAEETKAWRVLQQMAQDELAKFGDVRDETGLQAAADLEEEDEYAKEAPHVVLTNVENEGGGADGQELTPAGDDTEERLAEEKRRWEAWAAEGLPQITVTPVKKGLRSVTLLDLGSCHVGKKGLLALAEVLRTNTVLESLCLRHNPIGGSATKANAASQDADGNMSASFASFVEMLCVNKTLQTLDLGYCQLGPHHVRTLATALHVNSGLVTLGLEGNQLGEDEAYQQKIYPHSYLYEVWMAAAQPGSSLRHLHMSHNSVAICLWSEEAVALAAACGKLTSLSLSHVGLKESHLQLWLEALRQKDDEDAVTVRELQLARNELDGEAAGKALGMLLRYFTALEGLSLDDHPLLGSSGVGAALEFLPVSMRRLSCGGTGLTKPLLGAVQSPVIPPPVAEQLTSLVLSDVEALDVDTLGLWTAHLAASAQRIQYLSLWARGMAGKECDVLPLFVDLAKACPSLLFVDCGFQPQFQPSSPGAAHFAELEGVLVPRRMSLAI